MAKLASISLLIQVLISVSSMGATLPTQVTGPSVVSGKNLEAKAGARGLVVTFLSAKCPCSDSHIPILAKLSEQFKDFKFVAVHSNSDESAELTKAYFEKVHLPFEVVADAKSIIADQFKALKTPHTFVISPAGEVLYQGGVTDSATVATSKKNYLLAALTNIQAGQKVEVANGRTLGCIIQRNESANTW